ncbi:unnamed protein product [Owenia fusiformis]|uniref:Uncharacterized protein n=1 Tax=Owenia fusiformis TaxID=6347 RepID=A0A8J1TC16_OWEFU|nr:unnamed protein product [Owenia fusiformis]
MKNVIVILLFYLVSDIRTLPNEIKIGGLFGLRDPRNVENMMKYTVHRVTHGTEKYLGDSTLRFAIRYLSSDDSVAAGGMACRLVRSDVMAIFGPRSNDPSIYVTSLAGRLQIPHMETRFDLSGTTHEWAFNVYPKASLLARAYFHLTQHFQLKKVYMMYSNEDDFLQDVSEDLLNSGIVELKFRHSPSNELRTILMQARDLGYKHFMVELPEGDIKELFKLAVSLGMATPEYHYIVVNMDLQLVDLADAQAAGIGMTSFRLVNRDTIPSNDLLADIKSYEERTGSTILEPNGLLKTETALMYDAIVAFVQALSEAGRARTITNPDITCQGGRVWPDGKSLASYLNQIFFNGLSGQVTFRNGRRTFFDLDVLQLRPDGLKHVGSWSPADGLEPGDDLITPILPIVTTTPILTTTEEAIEEVTSTTLATTTMTPKPEIPVVSTIITDPKPETTTPDYVTIDPNHNTTEKIGEKTTPKGPNAGEVVGNEKELHGRNLRISTVLMEPWMMLKQDGVPRVGNDRYEGYIPDLLKELRFILGFDYQISQVSNGDWGEKTERGDWNGLVGELVRDEADLAAAPLKITNEREKVIDFTMPFMDDSMSLLVKPELLHKHTATEESFSASAFVVFRPFSLGVWLAIIGLFIFISFIMTLVYHFDPYEEKQELKDGTEAPRGQFNAGGSFWFTLSTMMMQGYAAAPKSIAGRLLAVFWFHFVLVVVISYAVSLYGVLYNQDRSPKPGDKVIDAIEDLTTTTPFSYGMIKSGELTNYFQYTTEKVHTKIWNSVLHHDTLVDNIEEGVKRTKQGDFALILETRKAEYLSLKSNCILKATAKSNLYKHKYGLAVSLGSPLRKSFNKALIDLERNSIVPKLYSKWWTKSPEESPCDFTSASKVPSNGMPTFSMKNLFGPLIIVGVGLILVMICAMIERTFHRKKKTFDDRRNIEELAAVPSPSNTNCYNTTPKELEYNGVPHDQEERKSLVLTENMENGKKEEDTSV